MTRVARYSSDQQTSASIEDQFLICREQAARDNYRIVGTYKDAAISGSSVILRPGIQALPLDTLDGPALKRELAAIGNLDAAEAAQ